MGITKIGYENKEEWLKLRRSYIGGSEAGAVIGMNPYKSAYTLWAEKTGRAEEFTGNMTTKVGEYLEAFVAKMFTEETGIMVRRNNFILVNDEYPFACADIDRDVVGSPAFLEIKTTTSAPIMRKINKMSEGDFPEMYYAQCVHYLAVTGYQTAWLAVLINCRELKIFSLDREEVEDDIKALMDAEKKFYEHIKNDVPPEIDGSESTSGTVDKITGRSVAGVEKDLTAFDGLISEYFALDKQIKVLQTSKDGIANRIKEFMGSAERGSSNLYSVSYKSQDRRVFDQKLFAEKNKDINLDPYFKITMVRPCKITQNK